MRNDISLLESHHRPPKILYHYCSSQTFLNIIQTNSLYLSCTKSTNDPQESTYIRSILKKIESEKINRGPIVDRLLFMNILRTLPKCQEENAFFGCFSEHKDTLNQWGRYPESSNGVAIGFDSDILNIISKNFSKLSLNKVIYDSSTQKNKTYEAIKYYSEICQEQDKNTNSKSVDQTISRLFENLRKHDVLNDKTNFDCIYNSYSSRCIQILLLLSYMFKEAGWEDEAEWRLCYYPNFNFLLPTDIQLQGINIEKITHRVSKEKIIMCHPLNFSGYKNIIKEIVIGPKCETSSKVIRSVLEENDFKKTTVLSSKIKLR